MRCTPAELDQLKRFETTYERAVMPTMRTIERRVCGCDYGGNSWLSRAQAEDLGRRLDLGPEVRLLDLGAGSGWPAIHLAKTFGCRAILVDLPEIGLRIADERAAEDGLADRIETLVADAADLPFMDASFDAISHCDLLCCLMRKKEVLANCRRVISSRGRMAYTVITIAPDLSDAEHRRAVATSPEFVETEADYAVLLRETGWSRVDRIDITPEYLASCERQIDADRENEDQLAALIGRDAYEERAKGWRDKLATIRDGLVVRELFVALP